LQSPIGRLYLCRSEQALGQEGLELLGDCERLRAGLIEQLLRSAKIPRVDRRLSGLAEVGDMRIVRTECADTYQQRLVVCRNVTQLRIEVCKGDMLLLKDFEKARQGSLRDTQLCGQTLKLFRRNALVLRNSNKNVMSGDMGKGSKRRACCP